MKPKQISYEEVSKAKHGERVKWFREIKARTVMIRCSSGLKLLESDLYSTLANEELRTGVCFSRRALCRETNVAATFWCKLSSQWEWGSSGAHSHPYEIFNSRFIYF